VAKARVILFKRSGKYYTEEEWTVPLAVRDHSQARGDFWRDVIGPYDMDQSPDFRRIDGGPVLVESQEPWGYPALFPTPDLRDEVQELCTVADLKLSEHQDRQLILEGLIRDLRRAVERAR
jgi:hypothetical protein